MRIEEPLAESRRGFVMTVQISDWTMFRPDLGSTFPKAPRKTVTTLEQTCGKGGMTFLLMLTRYAPWPFSYSAPCIGFKLKRVYWPCVSIAQR